MWKSASSAALVVIMIGGTVGLGAQKPVPSFDADVLTFYKLADGRVVSTTGHVYRASDGRTREDSGLGAVITDLNAKTVTLLSFENKQALVFDLTAAPTRSKSQNAVATAFGRTTLEGFQAIKARGVGPGGEKLEVWTAESVKAIVFTRTEAPGITKTRYLRNIAVRELDPAIFAVPQGYAVTRQTPPAGFDLGKSVELPGFARGRGEVLGVGRGRGGK